MRITTPTIGLLLSWLPTALGWTAETVLETFYDDSLASDKEYNITVGIQTTIGDWALGDEGTFILYANLINNQSILLPNHHIRLIMKDDNLDTQRAFFVGLELNGVDWGPHAEEPVEAVDFLFGAGYSGTSMSSAVVSKSFETPMMSCTATSADLSDKGTYGTFSRTISSDATQSCAWAAIASFFNWTSVGLITSNTANAQGLFEEFNECKDQFNITIADVIQFEANVTDHEAQLSFIDGNGVFIYYIAMHNEDIVNLARSLDEMGLSGFPYVYISSDAAGDDTSGIIQYISGLIYTAPFQVIQDTDQMLELKAIYNTTNMALDDPSSSGVGLYGPYCWDVALLMVDFFDNYTQMYPDTTAMNGLGNYWSSFLQSHSGEGASSTDLGFDEYLDPTLSRWTINNCDDSSCWAIGEASTTSAFLYYGVYDDAEEVYWPGGLRGIENTPLDHTTTTMKWIYIGDAVKIFYGLFAGITLSVTIWLICLTICWRDKEAIRMSAYKVNILTLIGLDILCLSFCFGLLDEKNYSQAELDTFCFAQVSTLFIGFPLFTGTIFSKIYRVHKIFNSRRYSQQKRGIKDSFIMQIVAMYMFINLAIIVVFQQISPWRRVIIEETPSMIDVLNYEQKLHGQCQMEQNVAWQLVLCMGNGSVLILGAKWAWDTRKVYLSALNDSIQVGYILMLIILLASFNIICLTLISDPNFVFWIIFISYLIVAWFTIGVLFLWKYWNMLYGDMEEDDHSNDEQSRTTSQKCPHCHKSLLSQASSYNIHDTGGEGGAAVEMQPEPTPFRISTQKRSKVKTADEMNMDELMDEIDGDSELDDIDSPKGNKDANKE